MQFISNFPLDQGTTLNTNSATISSAQMRVDNSLPFTPAYWTKVCAARLPPLFLLLAWKRRIQDPSARQAWNHGHRYQMILKHSKAVQHLCQISIIVKSVLVHPSWQVEASLMHSITINLMSQKKLTCFIMNKIWLSVH